MKVISIKQPWASLIINGYKKYEFRSFKTKYRGDILIHASKGYNDRIKDFKHLNLDFPTGQIIGKVTITDCVLIDDKIKKDLIKENELVYKNASGYGFKLENIEKIKPIEINGQLGLWNYYDEFEIMKMMDEIKYGFKDENVLQAPNNVIKNKLGVCFEQVELERKYFNGWKTKTYFISYHDNTRYHTHTFLVFEKNNKYYWFEHAYEKYKGIFEYDNLNELLIDVRNKFIEDTLKNDFVKDYLTIREYKKVTFPINIDDFFDYCYKNQVIELK